MSHAELCPVCHGTGEISNYGPTTTSTAPIMKQCHGCVGSGWVTVMNEEYVTTFTETPATAEKNIIDEVADKRQE